jgi:hypothetical protein
MCLPFYCATTLEPMRCCATTAGARIGLVDDLKPKFKIAWNDDNNPAVGFKYLYLSDKDYQALPEVYQYIHIYIIQYSTYIIQYSMYIIQCSIYIIPCSIYFIQCSIYVLSMCCTVRGAAY